MAGPPSALPGRRRDDSASLLKKTTFNELPFKFEAGTPDYIGTTGLAKALDYVNGIGLEQIAAHEHELTTYALQRLKEIPTMRIFGEAADRGAVISFLVGDIHHFDLGTLLDRLGIAVRTGHHCAQPLMQRLGIEGTVRASFAMYNTKSKVIYWWPGLNVSARCFKDMNRYFCGIAIFYSLTKKEYPKCSDLSFLASNE